MQSAKPKPSMGILQLNESVKKFQLTRYAPSEPLRHFIKHYWHITWHLEGQDPYLQDVVPNPCVNMVIEAHHSGIYGVASRKYTKQIEGNGQVFGVKFHPGGFYPFIGTPLSELTDKAMSIASVFGDEAPAYAQQIAIAQEPVQMISLMEELMLKRLPEEDSNLLLIQEMIASITKDSDLTKVEQLCEQFSINKRTLQRLFSQYVGVAPKWVIQLYRLQNAAEALDKGADHDLLKLSADLGYFDQSHFIKDFKSIIGKTPEQYVKA